jgi:PAS domain S-box-containing protein
MLSTRKVLFNRLSIRLAITVLAVAAAFLLRLFVDRYVGVGSAPFVTFYPAVMVAALLAGFWPGLLATALSALLVDYWIIPPHGSFAITRTSDVIVLAFFCAMGVFISAVAEGYRRNLRRVDAYKIEQALAKDKERLAQTAEQRLLALETANLGAWDYRFDTGDVFWDERCRNMWGIPTGDRFDYDECIARIHPSDRLATDEAVKLAIAGVDGGAYNREFRIFWPDGSLHWIASHGHAYFDGNGTQRRASRFVGVNMDITERKQADEAQARLAAIVHSSGDAIIGKDLDGIVTTWNRSAERIFGYSAAEIIGQPLTLIIPPDRQAEEIAFLERLRDGDSIEHFETVRVAKCGRHVDVSVTISPICDASGTVIGISKSVRDITERKQAEEAIRRQADMLRLSFDAIVVWRLGGAIESWNHGAEQLYGYTESEALGRVTHELLKTTRAVPWPRVEQELRERGTWEGELRHITKDGREVIVSTRHQLIADAAGVELILETNRDITERKQAEQAIRESQAQFRTLADAIPQLCWIANADGYIFWYNQRWYEYTGTTPQQMEGWGWQSVHDPHTLPKVLERWNRSIATAQPFNMVFPLRGGDGVFRPFLTRVMPVKDASGNVVQWFGTNTDVTELRNAQDALRASEQRWATTLQSIGDAVISTDAHGNVEFMNDVAQRLTGWSLPEAKGRDMDSVFNIVNEVTRIKPESPVAKVIRLGQVIGLANHTALIRPDGTEIAIEDSAAPIRDRSGQIEGVVLVFRDVTDQRRTEKALRDSDRLATTGRLAATIAHEIHNPLDAVGNLLHLIAHGTQEDTTREYAAMASRELARTTQMTQQMLAFQREAAKPVPVNIREILDNVTALYERKIKSAGINLEQQISFDGQILALPGELRQIFANLVGNAIEAVGPRPGTITLRAYSSRDRRAQRLGLRIVVADDGRGIPAHVRKRIFEPFFTTKGESGTGLGLWISSGILRKYEGTIQLRTSTQPGRSGTCFSVFLPFDTTSA